MKLLISLIGILTASLITLPNVYGHSLIGSIAHDYSGNEDCLYYDKENDLILTCGGEFNINKLSLLLNNTSLLYEESDKVWVLNASLSVSKGTSLKLLKDEIIWLKIIDDDTINHIQVLGDLLVDGVKITSWDPVLNDYSRLKGPTDPRPHLFTVDGNMKIRNSFIGYLGYDESRSHGLDFYDNKGHEVINSTITNNYYGLYTDHVTSMVIDNNRVFDNIVYGLDPHTYSMNLTITNNIVYNNGNHGIICSRFCKDGYIANNTVYDNRGHGIMLDRNVTNFIVRDNTLTNNDAGIMLFGSSDNTVINNTIINHKQGIRMSDSSFNNYIADNHIESANAGIYILDDTYNNVINNNRVIDVKASLYIENSNSSINMISNSILEGISAVRLYNGNIILSNNSYHCSQCFITDGKDNNIKHINDNIYNINYKVKNSKIEIIDDYNYLYNTLVEQHIGNNTRLSIDKDGVFVINKENIRIMPNNTINLIYDNVNKTIHINNNGVTKLEIKGADHTYTVENYLYKGDIDNGILFITDGNSRVYLDLPHEVEEKPSLLTTDKPLDLFYSGYTIVGILLSIAIFSFLLSVKKR